MRMKLHAVAVVSTISIFGCSGGTSPVEPALVSSSVASVSLVALDTPSLQAGIQVSVRLEAADGSNVEFLPCSIRLSRVDGERWEDTYISNCLLLLSSEEQASPAVEGLATFVFRAPIAPNGRYELRGVVRRVGRLERIPVRAEFRL
jgi:hypothetical protein